MGTICSSKTSKRQNPGLTVEAVIIICEFSDQTSPCSRECGHQTEVFLEAFSPTILITNHQFFGRRPFFYCYFMHILRDLCIVIFPAALAH